MIILSDKKKFPDPELVADPDGLVALGGDLSVKRLLTAYKNGIFPWETEPIIGWYSPDPRCILETDSVRVSNSMKAVINKKNHFEFKLNTSFHQVIYNCKNISRKNVEGSWISEELINSFLELHALNYAYSAETWYQNKLVGGLYGLLMGNIFFGESMFSTTPNASKYALIMLARHLQKNGVKVIDCQVYSAHLESMGAKLISRKQFLELLKKDT